MAVDINFDEILLDPDIFTAGSATGGPTYANTMGQNAQTGVRKVNVGRYDFIQIWNIQTDLLEPEDLAYFANFWAGGYGSAYGFRCVVVSDFFMIDEAIGTGDSVQTVFPLIKTYKRPGANHAYAKRIIKPVTNTNVTGGVTLYEADGATSRIIPSRRGAALGVPAFTVKKDATPTTAYTINNTTGVITFTAAPANGVVIKVSCEFDHPVQFLMNSFQLKPDQSSDISGLQIGEILPAQLGIT